MDGGRLLIEGDLNYETAEKVRQLLVSRIAAGKAVDVEIAGLGDVDILGIQVLLSAGKTCAGNGQPFRLEDNEAKTRINRFLQYTGLPAFP